MSVSKHKRIYKVTSKMFISCVKWHNFFHLRYIQCTRTVVSVHWFKYLLTFEGKCQYRIWVWVYENVNDSFQNHSFHFVENRSRYFISIIFFFKGKGHFVLPILYPEHSGSMPFSTHCSFLSFSIS